VSEDINRTEFCERTGWREVGESSDYGIAWDTLNRILSEKPRNISKTSVQRLADTLGLSVAEFTTGKPLLSGSIAEDNGWEARKRSPRYAEWCVVSGPQSDPREIRQGGTGQVLLCVTV
jgi:hypothetical protein